MFHLRGRDPDLHRQLITPAGLDEFIDWRRPHFTSAFAVDARREIRPDEYSFDDGRADSVRLYRLFDEGATLVLRNHHEHSPALARLCRSAEKIFGCPFGANVYYAPPGGSCFPIHHDVNDVFALQVAGTKRWDIYRPILELPLSDQGSYEALKPETEARELELAPGDVLYCPRGFPHLVYSTTEPSFHISLASYPYTWTDAIVRAVSAACRTDPAFRASLPRHFLEGQPRPSDLQHFAQLTKKAAELASFAPAAAAIAEEFVRSRPLAAPGLREQERAARELSLESLAERRPDAIYMLQKGSQTVRLVHNNTAIDLPASVLPALEHVLTAGAFRIAALPGGLEEEDKLELIRTLIRQGLLTVRGADVESGW